MPNARGHSWRFKTRFRRHAFGWKSQPAITRLQEALSEIRQVARLEPILAAEGAIALLERISPALEHVDSSSGAIGSAVNRTIAELVPVIAGAPADARTRAAWLDRLFEAHAADQIPYIERSSSTGASCVAPGGLRPNGRTACSTSRVWRSQRTSRHGAISTARRRA